MRRAPEKNFFSILFTDNIKCNFFPYFCFVRTDYLSINCIHRMVHLRPSITFYRPNPIQNTDHRNRTIRTDRRQQNHNSPMAFHPRQAQTTFRQQVMYRHQRTVCQTNRQSISILAAPHRDQYVRRCLVMDLHHCCHHRRINCRHNRCHNTVLRQALSTVHPKAAADLCR